MTTKMSHINIWPPRYHTQIYDHLDILHNYTTIPIPHTNTWPLRYPTHIHDHRDITHKYMTTYISHTHTIHDHLDTTHMLIFCHMYVIDRQLFNKVLISLEKNFWKIIWDDYFKHPWFNSLVLRRRRCCKKS